MLALLVCVATARAEVVVERFDDHTPRAYGYVIGDKFERVLHLSLRQPYQLDEKSLPAAGRLSRWLSVQKPRLEQSVHDGATHYRIHLVYQLVSIDADVREIAVPQSTLRYANASETLKIMLPAWRIRVGAVSDFSGADLQASQMPASLPESYRRAALFAAVLLLAVGGCAGLRFGLPFSARHNPFAGLYAQMRKHRHQTWDEAAYRSAVQDVHRAFNVVARKTLFRESLQDFFADHRHYAPLAREVEAFFSHSRELFFAPPSAAVDFHYSRAALADLVRQCRDAERGQA